MRDRDELLAQARNETLPEPKEISRLFEAGSPAFQLLGLLVRRQEEIQLPFLSVDLVSEAGRLEAIKYQGRIAGRAEFLDEFVDLILEGSQENE